MTLLSWTLWVVGAGISLIALSLAIFQYFNVKRRRKIVIVRRSILWGIVVLIFAWLLGLIFIVKNESELRPATTQDIEQIVDRKLAEYVGEKPKSLPVEEVKSDIEKELKVASNEQIEAFKKKVKTQEKEALELYEKGKEAYDNNKSKEAITHFDASLNIVKTASF